MKYIFGVSLLGIDASWFSVVERTYLRYPQENPPYIDLQRLLESFYFLNTK